MQGDKARFLIIGGGAIGSVFGGFLARAGNQVTFCDRDTPHILAVKRQGLTVTGIWGEFLQRDNIIIETDKDRLDPGGYDYACIAVKSYHTGAVLGEYEKVLGASTHVVSLQNGVGNVLEMAEWVGRDRAIGVRIIFGAELESPGTAKVTVKADDLALGWLKGAAAPGDGADTLNRIFNGAGLDCRLVDDVRAFLWAKVLYNSSLNGLGAILGVPYGELLEREPTRLIMRQLMAEAFDVLQAEGVDMPWPDANAYIKTLFEELIPPTAAHRASMLQDIELGRPTEIDALNGYIAALARKYGLPATGNETITNLVKFIEAARAQK